MMTMMPNPAARNVGGNLAVLVAAVVGAVTMSAVVSLQEKKPAPAKPFGIGLLPGEVPTNVSSDPRQVPIKK